MIDFPSNPTDGQVFTSGNSSWVWNATASQWRTSLIALNPKVQRLSGDGTTVQFTLNSIPPNINFLDIYISGIYQQKNTYTVVGNVLTFSEAPPTGTENIEVEWGSSLDVGVPSDASVTATKLASGAAVGNLGYTPVNKAGDTMTGNLTVPERIELFTDGVNGTQRHGRISGIASSNNPYAGGIKLEYYNFNGSNYQFYDGLLVDGAGRITTPNQPAFSASKSNGGSQTTEVVFNNVYENRGSHYNSTTGRFTAPVAGLYFFSAGLMASGTNNYLLWKFLRNGTIDTMSQWFQAHSAAVSNNVTQTGSVVVYLAAGDYVSVNVAASYPNYYTSGYNVFCGYLIG